MSLLLLFYTQAMSESSADGFMHLVIRKLKKKYISIEGKLVV